MSRLLLVFALALSLSCQSAPRRGESYEVVVYGGTSGAVTAAVQAARDGRRVVLVSPTTHLGGLSSNGLGATDVGNRGAIGGLSREFYARIKSWYDDEAHWTRQDRAGFKPYSPDADVLWRFEPHVAEWMFEALVAEAGVPVLRGERLDRENGVEGTNERIDAIVLESGHRLRGDVFIDATYEGDLMALAGVTYTVGREGNERYGETLNGVQTGNAKYHQFYVSVDPYRVTGDPSSGLLPGVHGDGPGAEGSGDRRIQAYNYRVCLTDDPENRVPFAKPADYDELDYELLLRHFEAGAERLPWHSLGMPNRKTDTNNNRAFSTDFIGANYGYPEGDYATRERIEAEHERYQRGLLWTLANHPRVPERFRTEAARWGLAGDEFAKNGNWPRQIYVREARRMVSDYVMTEHDCMRTRRAPDPVGLGAYNMDSHNVQRYVDGDGFARNEGDVQVAPAGPYGISYRSIVPARGECENLLVPVCVSASHISYGSIRMEPVFMILGQSAAIAADLALADGRAVQNVEYDELRERLVQAGQILGD